MLAFALRNDGWWLRQDIVWNKPSPMPESVLDRCTKAHEYIFLMSKSPRYYFDSQAIAEPLAASSIERLNQPNIDNQAGSDRVPGKTNGAMKAVVRGGVNAFRGQGHFRDGENGPANRDGRDMKEVGSGATRNKRSVWTVTTRPFKEAHFATFPPKLIEPCILAGCPVGGLVLDPFNGSGTAGVVALQNGRRYVGCELNEAYLDMSIARIKTEANAPRLPGFDEAMQGAAKRVGAVEAAGSSAKSVTDAQIRTNAAMMEPIHPASAKAEPVTGTPPPIIIRDKYSNAFGHSSAQAQSKRAAAAARIVAECDTLRAELESAKAGITGLNAENNALVQKVKDAEILAVLREEAKMRIVRERDEARHERDQYKRDSETLDAVRGARDQALRERDYYSERLAKVKAYCDKWLRRGSRSFAAILEIINAE